MRSDCARFSDRSAGGLHYSNAGLEIGPDGELTGKPGVQSVSNGIAEPPGDTFALDQAQFKRPHDPEHRAWARI